MVELDRAEFALAVGAMCETFGQDATPQFIRGYWIGLSDIDLASVQLAVARAIRECERLPKPVELRRLTGEATDEQAATIAWDDVLRALPRGPYKHVDFENKLINAVIRNLGGWPSFVHRFTDSESEKWTRMEFLRAYRNLSAGVSDEACAPLPGIAQVTNYGSGPEPIKPIRIACQSRPKHGLRIAGKESFVKRIS
jgi:hypothetical protein